MSKTFYVPCWIKVEEAGENGCAVAMWQVEHLLTKKLNLILYKDCDVGEGLSFFELCSKPHWLVPKEFREEAKKCKEVKK